MGAHQSLWRERGHQAMDKIGINKVYDRYFISKEIKQFEEFHVAFIDLFRDFTSLFPGTRYNVPTSDEIEEFYREWKNLEKEEEKKTQFCDFMNKNIVFSGTHHTATIVTGTVAPSAAVIVQKTWENTPLLNIIPLHHIPTFIFVPSFTMLSLIGIKVVHILE